VEARTESTTAEGAAKTASTLSEIAQRKGFLETSDPALQESADRGEAHLLGYTELYELWERQQWRTQDLDFSGDRTDWNERIEPEERYQRMYGLSAFFIGEQRVTDELGPIMRAAPTEEQRIFLSTQIADEARHVRFFNRFYQEVGVLDGADDLAARLRATEEHLNPAFADLFDGMLKSKVDKLAREPENTELLVESVTLYHMIIEPWRSPASTSSSSTTRSRTRCPGSSRGSRTSPATSIATSPSGFASSPTWRSRTSAIARRSSAPWRRRCRSPTRCSTRRGRRRTTGSCSDTPATRRMPSPPSAYRGG
jgi:hypothetical protein